MKANKPATRFPREADQAHAIVRELLGDAVIGVYLFGSAVVGGLRKDSDVDVLAAVNQSTTFVQRRRLVARLMKVSGAVGNGSSTRPLELTVINVRDVVPWRFPPRAEFVYGEWLREDFERGAVPDPVRDPDLAIVIKKAIDNSVPLFGREPAYLFAPVPIEDILRAMRESLPGLLERVDGDERNVMLTLARMWLTAATGDIAPKDVAAQWAASRLPVEQAFILGDARLGYLGELDDSWHGTEEELREIIRTMQTCVEACLESRMNS